MTTNLEEAYLRAAQKGDKEGIISAIEKGVDVNVCDGSGRNALDKVARTEDNNEVIGLLLANDIKVHKSLLTDKKANLDENTRNHLGNVYNQQCEKLKAELKKKGPEINFTMQKNDGHVSGASVVFPGVDDNLKITFALIRDSLFKGDNLSLITCMNDKEVDKYNIAKEASPFDVDKLMQNGIIPYLEKVKFNGNAASLNKIIAEAQKAVLKKWPDYKKELQAQKAKQEQQRLAETDEVGKHLQGEYGFLFEEDKNNKKTKNPPKIVARIASAREKIQKGLQRLEKPVRKKGKEISKDTYLRLKKEKTQTDF